MKLLRKIFRVLQSGKQEEYFIGYKSRNNFVSIAADILILFHPHYLNISFAFFFKIVTSSIK